MALIDTIPKKPPGEYSAQCGATDSRSSLHSGRAGVQRDYLPAVREPLEISSVDAHNILFRGRKADCPTSHCESQIGPRHPNLNTTRSQNAHFVAGYGNHADNRQAALANR